MDSIVILVASTGNNAVLAQVFEKSLNERSVEVHAVDLCALDLPMYTPGNEAKGIPLPGFRDAAAKVRSAKGLIVCAPEYNGSMPPVLNNFIAWLSTSTDDFREHFNGKSIGLASHSGGGGQNLMTSMRIQFSHLGANVLGRVAVLNNSKPLNQQTIESLIEGVLR